MCASGISGIISVALFSSRSSYLLGLVFLLYRMPANTYTIQVSEYQLSFILPDNDVIHVLLFDQW